ncbi:hypothetical protein [Paracoccus mutanolyticus]|uniref:hypothetical protein n=1 Tax=Paracoccus mutanolyticus TaxID=1499308 RepID=UPI0016725CB9|nr:hypothetical protein [Paracoccus mutanolyticus]
MMLSLLIDIEQETESSHSDRNGRAVRPGLRQQPRPVLRRPGRRSGACLDGGRDGAGHRADRDRHPHGQAPPREHPSAMGYHNLGHDSYDPTQDLLWHQRHLHGWEPFWPLMVTLDSDMTFHNAFG